MVSGKNRFNHILNKHLKMEICFFCVNRFGESRFCDFCPYNDLTLKEQNLQKHQLKSFRSLSVGNQRNNLERLWKWNYWGFGWEPMCWSLVGSQQTAGRKTCQGKSNFLTSGQLHCTSCGNGNSECFFQTYILTSPGYQELSYDEFRGWIQDFGKRGGGVDHVTVVRGRSPSPVRGVRGHAGGIKI